MKARNWLEIKAEAERLNPWLTSPEADALAAEDTARIETERQGYALSTLRKESGRTQKELAEVMGVSQARISQIEHGRIDSLELLRSYISAIGGTLHLKVDQGPVSVTIDLPRVTAPQSRSESPAETRGVA